ncbi:clp protease adapter protein ClpF, chloroplastic-like isoform X1 [Argonauta hians]
MPLQRIAVLQLGLLLLVIPFQYIITRISPTSESQRTHQLQSFVKSLSDFKQKYLSWDIWRQWCYDLYESVNSKKPDSDSKTSQDEESEEESPAYFASSLKPRLRRPSNVEFRVGQVVKHKILGYHGVIIGWDEVAIAPKSWLERNHPPSKSHWKTMPNYSILVDTRDRLAPQITYVPQENIQVISHTQIFHPEIDNYFEKYDGTQYLPRPSIRRIYPYG